MTDAKVDVSVVICTYAEERWEDLVAAVESVQEQSVAAREIIVAVDNNARLFERVRRQMAGIVVIENREQRGSSGTRNSGIAIAQGSLIAFLDDDAIAEPGWLKGLSESCANADVLGAGGVVEPLWADTPTPTHGTSTRDTHKGRPYWFPEEFYWVVGCSFLDGISGAPTPGTKKNATFEGCACIRREVFEIVGGFRNGMGRVNAYPPMGGEGAELCIRARLHWPERFFVMAAEAKIQHRIPSHRASWRYFRARCFAEGRSKALVTRYASDAGAKDSLSSERTYVYRTLPRGVMRGLGDALLRFDLTGLSRAGAIITGLLLTTAGYFVGMIASSHGSPIPDKHKAPASNPIAPLVPTGRGER